MGRLEGKVAIVTGGAQGMGLAHVKRFAAEGARVVLTDVKPEGAERAREIGKDVLFVHHDVADAAAWADVVRQAEEHFGPVNVLVNNAAIGTQLFFDELTEAEYRRFFDINQLSVFLGMKAVVPSMRKAGGGSIINVSSTCGFIALPGTIAYTSTKFAVRGLTKGAAMDLGQDNIRVNSVHPGNTRTPMLEKAIEQGADLVTRQPIKRIAEPEEVANLVLYLASDESSYSTGSEFIVDGGITCAH